MRKETEQYHLFCRQNENQWLPDIWAKPLMLKDIEEKKNEEIKTMQWKWSVKKKTTLKFWRKNAISLKQQDAFFFFKAEGEYSKTKTLGKWKHASGNKKLNWRVGK